MVDFQCQQLRNRPTGSQDASTLGDICWWCCMVSLVIGLILAYAWFNNQVIDVSYQIEKLKNENVKLRESTAELRAEQAVLMSPERISHQAVAMGLVSPDRKEVRILQAGYVEMPSDAMVAISDPARKPLHE
jgi:hypothetical protein